MIFSKMVRFIKVLRRMAKEMVKVCFIIKMVDVMKVSGRTIKCLDMENYTIKLE